ncbi:MAG: T9SS type A sorting domain-containing protein [Ignavibacteriaceae bacterium]|jgi:plastocyanin
MKFFRIPIYVTFLFALTNIIYAQSTHIIQVADFAFTPSNLTIAIGDTVKWVWVSGMHTTTSDSTTGVDSWNAPITQTQPSFSLVLKYPGLHTYYCIYHVSLGMTGKITVGGPTPVKQVSQQPNNFILEQNYPNPFNPTTEIKYSIANTGFVILEVYDVVGNKIGTLINQMQSPGKYSAVFSAGNLPSGIYFYQLKVGNLTETKKMLLLK